MVGNSSGTSPKIDQDQPLAVLPDVVLSSRSMPIPVTKQPIISNDLKDWAEQIEMESTASPPISGAADGSTWENVNGYQKFFGWVASNFVSGATFKIKMALFSSFEKLPLATSDSFFSPLAGSSFLVKVPSKRHTQLVFSALTTTTTISTTTALQMATKAKYSKKQQQAIATAMVTPNPFVVLNEIFSKISIAAASPLSDMDGNSSSIFPKMGQDQPLTVLPNVVLFGRLLPIPVAKQSINPDSLKDWADQMKMESTVSLSVSGAVDDMVSNLVLSTTFKIKMALLNAVKLFCVEFTSQKSLNGITKVAIMASVFFPSLLVVLHDIPLGIFFNNIKTAFGIFGVVSSVKLKPAGLWEYAVVNFEDIFSAAAALSNWFVLVRKNSVRIFLIVNQKEVIFSKDAFKAKLVNFLFGCTVFEISDLVSQVDGHTCFISHSPEFY
ncbi:hypothetical protein G9A89_012789 [Geosiphon pyriformis]|nr:hypothetical protein G9A89_012789 [Geosiphon pyriformis]